ncbi:MAG: FMN-binding protein [Candidatus Omnitrophica bacterium]|nr:FMN-binding protein [Candidatus Omnitrophota bacterium]
MRNTVRIISVLTVVGLISGTALVLMYNYANPRIIKNQKNEMEKAVYKLFPNAKKYDKVAMGDDVVFKVTDKSGKSLGYAFIAEGNGYQGPIKMMAGIKPDLATLEGIEILESQETPGLGQEIASDNFRAQFDGLKTSPEITYVKNAKPGSPNEIQAITGATISSKAVCTILNEQIKTIKQKLSK